MTTIADIKASDLTPLLSKMEGVWREMKMKMASSIPLRQTVCRFSKEVKTARIATSEELENLLFSCSLGLFMTHVELKRKGEQVNAAWVMEARFCVLVPGHGYVTLHNAFADVTASVADMDPVMTAQTYAIKNVLRMAGFKAEEEFDDPFDALASAQNQTTAEQGISADAAALCDIQGETPAADTAHKVATHHSDEPEMPESWQIPTFIDAETVRNLIQAKTKPIDYTETLMELIKQIRNADPVLKKMKWSHLFQVSIGHIDPPTRLSGLTTKDMEDLASLLLKFNGMGA